MSTPARDTRHRESCLCPLDNVGFSHGSSTHLHPLHGVANRVHMHVTPSPHERPVCSPRSPDHLVDHAHRYLRRSPPINRTLKPPSKLTPFSLSLGTHCRKTEHHKCVPRPPLTHLLPFPSGSSTNRNKIPPGHPNTTVSPPSRHPTAPCCTPPQPSSSTPLALLLSVFPSSPSHKTENRSSSSFLSFFDFDERDV